MIASISGNPKRAARTTDCGLPPTPTQVGMCPFGRRGRTHQPQFVGGTTSRPHLHLSRSPLLLGCTLRPPPLQRFIPAVPHPAYLPAPSPPHILATYISSVPPSFGGVRDQVPAFI